MSNQLNVTSGKLRLYNTMSKSVEELNPLSPPQVRMYCCGPTVYHFQHLGNLRTYLFEDLLARTIRLAGFDLVHVMNITDVGHLVSDADAGEDKMMLAMRRENKRSHEVAAFYTKAFFEDCSRLNINRPNVVCNATDHINEMIALIKRLEERGATYVAGGNVYFDISKSPDYGKLARLNLQTLEAGARIAVDSQKRNPMDFVLWFTKSKFEGQELQWDSPWGTGYPGWHIECSAMSMKYCGEEFDIHCGGIDHVPVHHTNEIAQSETATGKQFSRIWMHGGFLVNEKNEKMAKSKGEFLCVKELVERGFDPICYRLLCFGSHYRNQLTFSWEAVASASQSLERLRRAITNLKAESANSAAAPLEVAEYQKRFEGCLLEDLNAPQALAVVWEVIGSKVLSASTKLALMRRFDEYLGLSLLDVKAEEVEIIPAAITDLLNQRLEARKAKNFARSDEIRSEIQNLGYQIEDGPKGTSVRKIVKN